MKPSKNIQISAGLFSRSKKSLAISTALLSLSLGSVANANDNQNSLLAAQDSMIPTMTVQSKFRAVDKSRAIKDQYIVVLKDQTVNQQVSSLAGFSALSADAAMDLKRQVVQSISTDMAGLHSAQISRQYHAALSGFVAKMSAKDMRKLMADKRVAYVEQDQMMKANATQFNATWGLDRIDQASLPLNSEYTYNQDGSGVKAYIVDTGVLASHSNFGGRVGSGYTAINDGNGTNDCNGHGTHVAGTVGSTTWGVAKNVSLIPVRVLGCNGSGSNSGVIAGVDWVAQNASGPSVANMSLGGGSSSALDNSVRNAINQGVTFVVAAGNSNSDACVGSPNRVGEALTIASSTSSDARSSFSSWGSCIDLFAPGSSITSTWSNGGSNTISGTSMAAPHVAGAVALYLENNRNASPSQVETAIKNNAVSGKISNRRGSPNLLVQTNPGGGGGGGGGGGVDPIDATVNDISVARNAWKRYTLALGSGYSNLTVSISGGSGDADLYVNFGSQSTTSNYDCRPYRNGNNETCSFNSPAAGTWHIDIRGYTAASGVTLRATAN